MNENRLTAEREVVGRLIFGADLGEVTLSPDDFQGQGTKWLFKRIVELSKVGLPIEPGAIMSQRNSDVVKYGIGSEIASCMTVAISNSNVGFYVNELRAIISEEKKLRIREHTTQLLADGGDIRETLTKATEAIDKIEAQYGSRDNETLADAAFRLFEHIGNETPTKDQILTYLKTIDDTCYGLIGGDLVILAARPSMGKTALALTIMGNQARNGIKTAFFSLEQSSISVASRILANITKQSTARALRRPQDLTPAQKMTFMDAWGEVFKIAEKIVIFERPRQTISEIETQAVKAVKSGCRAIYIDYLGQMRFPGKLRYDLEISETCERLKALGKMLDVPVICLSQLSRSNVKENRAPQLSDLRDSGGIEQAADFVLFLHCKEDDAKKSGEKWFIQAKGRDAGIGSRVIYFDAPSVTFFDMEKKNNDGDERKYGTPYNDD